jgi:hypothetical protein
MRTEIRASAISLLLAASVSTAGAQTTSMGAQEKLNLNSSQERSVSQGLSAERAQPSQGYQGQVGSKLPDSITARSLPDSVTQQVPQTKSYLFVKLPDRILLIDPDSKMVAEIVADSADTTGSGSVKPGSTGSDSKPPQ